MAKKIRSKKTTRRNPSASKDAEPRKIRGWVWTEALKHGPPLQIYASPIMLHGKAVDTQVEIVEVVEG